jgi:TetR/AcrR family transcriptional repressor of mexJK operon
LTTKAKNSPKRKSTRRPYSPGRPTLEDLEQRKKRILEVATSLFLQQGYAEASLVDVAKRAGVATRTIYQHFGNKEAIFRAVIDRHTMHAEAEFPTIDTDQPLYEVLVSTAHHICEFGLSDAAIPIQRLMVAESQRFPTVIRQVFQSLYEHFHTNVMVTFEKLASEGKIPQGDHAQSTKYFIDLLLGSAPMQLSMRWISSGPSEEEIQAKVSLYIAGRFGLTPPAPAMSAGGKKNRKLKAIPA